MPRSKDLTHYPYRKFYAIFYHVATRREPITIAEVAGVSALTFRGLLYAFRRAVKRQEGKARSLGIDPELMEVVQLRMDGDKLVIEHRECSPVSQGVDKMLAELGVEELPMPEPAPKAQTPEEASLQKLLSNLGRG